jgi:hypothetical protein
MVAAAGALALAWVPGGLREAPLEYAAGGAEPRRRPDPIPERLLAQLWRKRAARRDALYDNRGRRVRVLYPGRPGGGPGPDFRDALLEMEGLGVVRGDVEVHRRAGDWDAHGHGRDPSYNSVVLHVALEAEETATRLPSGRTVPVLSLAPLLPPLSGPPGESAEGYVEGGGSPGADPPAPSRNLWRRLAARGFPQPQGVDELAALLDRAGEARFRAKSALFRTFLGQQSPDQTLYEAVMEGLGYRRNQQAFLKLAGRAPYAALRRAAGSLPSQERAGALQSWLLQLSGLAGDLGAAAPVPAGAGFGRPLDAGEWHTAGGRPANHPRRRLAGAARLLDRFLATGLAAGLAESVRPGSPRLLAQALTVNAEGGAGAAYIGRGRAGDVAVNVVLPLCHGLAGLGGDGGLEEACLAVYRGWSKLQDNEISREMADQLLAPGWAGAVSTARRQQGLLHLHHLLRGGG